MDDDPDPFLDQVILEGYEMSEQVLSVGELQKCSLEGNDENNVHQESGDNGPFLEQDVTKKTSSGKDAPDPVLQKDSKVNILKRKELVDQSQAPDAAGSIKSSTSLRKPSRRSLQRPPSQDSRCNSQQSVGQQAQLSQKSSRAQFINEVDTKDTMWVSKKTGKIMKCRSQQTSLIWEQKVPSEILYCSSEESDKSKEETCSEENITSEETTTPKESSESDNHQNSQKQEGKGTTYGNPKQESCRSSQQSSEEPSLLIPNVIDSEDEITWISPKTGREMKNKAQQTSIIWELKTLSEILRSSSQESYSHVTNTDTTEDAITSSGDTEVEQSAVKERKYSILQVVRGQESRRSSKQQEVKHFGQDTQQPEESKAKPPIKQEAHQYDQTQQTDSVEDLKKELLDYNQQTDFLTDSTNVSVDLKDSQHSTQEAEAQQPCHGSQDSQGTLQNLLEPVSQGHAGKESKVLISLKPEQNQEAFFTGEVDENTWISRKTGKVVKNQAQQTDKSWLQYCAAKKQKVKKCSSQQTDESFLQRYAANKMTISNRKVLINNHEHGQQGLRKFSSGSHDFDAPNVQFSDRDMSSLGHDATGRKVSKAYEPASAEACEGVQQLQCRNGGLTDQSPAAEVQWPDESESRSTMSASSIEEEDSAQQTYSIISLEDGIWLNRRTGKILISHSQQTSQTAIPIVLSTTSLQKAGSGVKKEELQSPGNGKDETSVKQGKSKVDGQQSANKESRRNSRASPDTQVITAQPLGENTQCTDDIEKLLSTRLSEAMLLSAESPDMEDELVELYTLVEEGSWVNVNTGRLLASQTQQTEEDADRFLVDNDQPSGDTFQQAPEILASSNNGMQLSSGEGMDDDPVNN